MKYRQCTLTRKLPNSNACFKHLNVTTTSYIPAYFAVVGKVVTLQDIDDSFAPWVIQKIGELEETSEMVFYRTNQSH